MKPRELNIQFLLDVVLDQLNNSGGRIRLEDSFISSPCISSVGSSKHSFGEDCVERLVAASSLFCALVLVHLQV